MRSTTVATSPRRLPAGAARRRLIRRRAELLRHGDLVRTRRMAISFRAFPRRVVELPNGRRALVAVRRHGPKLRWLGWTTPWDIVRTARWLLRLLRRDRTWEAEVYADVATDVELPYREPDVAWVLPSRLSAEAFAEDVCAALRMTGWSELPRPVDGRVLRRGSRRCSAPTCRSSVVSPASSEAPQVDATS